MCPKVRLFLDPMAGYNVRLSAALAIKARRMGVGNMADGIRWAIEQADEVLGTAFHRKRKELKKKLDKG